MSENAHNPAVASFRALFPTTEYFRIPVEEKDEEKYNRYFSSLTNTLLIDGRCHKKFWGMSMALGKLLNAIQIFSESLGHDIGTSITRVKKIFDDDIFEISQESFESAVEAGDLLSGLISKSYYDSIKIVKQRIADIYMQASKSKLSGSEFSTSK